MAHSLVQPDVDAYNLQGGTLRVGNKATAMLKRAQMRKARVWVVR